jgi:PRTRC genetic system protein C
MLVSSILPRVFILKQNDQNIKLPDPEATFTPEQVLNFYANTYPILTTTNVSAYEIKDDQMQYTFETTIQTKG